MPSTAEDRGRGALLVAVATVLWSSSGAIARLSSSDMPTMLFWRSVFASLFLLLALRVRRGEMRPLLHLGWVGWGVAGSFATSMVTFIAALRLTTVAHVLIFQAASPFLAAILAWAVLKEHVEASLMAAIAATIVGIGVMVSETLSHGHWGGDLLSLIMCATFALMIVLARLDVGVDMLAAGAAATGLAALVSLPFAHLPPSLGELALLAAFGIGQMGLGLMAFTAGVRLLPAADAGLISVLEAVLAPIWAWAGGR